MRKKIMTILGALLLSLAGTAQNAEKTIDKLKVFIDCSSTWCDMTFIRTEINIVDFMLDRIAADVHLLVTDQSTGSGGSKYQLIFFGQNTFKNQKDTFHFNTDPNATDFERRDMLIKYMKLGLASYVAKTNAAKDAVINFKRTETGEDNKDSATSTTKDPWNYWVFRVGVNGNLSADEVYKSSSLSFNLSANRVTEELKTGFEIYAGKNKTAFQLDNGNGTQEKITIKNDDYTVQHFLVKSLGPHWSYGYEAVVSRSTFSNNKRRALLRTGVEYAVFPYKEVNTKFFTVSYTMDIRRNNYFDTTLYEKNKETLFGHAIETNLSFNQK
ncbi:MAG: hypothetical protein H7Y01_15895, partial [Ferruginibacter sp.]|nr:hypothetical protein [Chitinophagaceae bacterium]